MRFFGYPLTSETFGRPAGFLAVSTFRRLRKISLAPMMNMLHGQQLLPGDIRGVLLAISDRKVLTFSVRVVFTNCEENHLKKFTKCVEVQLTQAMHGCYLIDPLSTNIAEPSLVMRRLGPAVSHRVLDQTWRDSGAWRNDRSDTLLMDNKVANCGKQKEISMI